MFHVRGHRPRFVSLLQVGAGPTGLCLALTLVQNGVNVRIIDKEPTPRIGRRGAGVTVTYCYSAYSSKYLNELIFSLVLRRYIDYWELGTIFPIRKITPYSLRATTKEPVTKLEKPWELEMYKRVLPIVPS